MNYVPIIVEDDSLPRKYIYIFNSAIHETKRIILFLFNVISISFRSIGIDTIFVRGWLSGIDPILSLVKSRDHIRYFSFVSILTDEKRDSSTIVHIQMNRDCRILSSTKNLINFLPYVSLIIPKKTIKSWELSTIMDQTIGIAENWCKMCPFLIWRASYKKLHQLMDHSFNHTNKIILQERYFNLILLMIIFGWQLFFSNWFEKWLEEKKNTLKHYGLLDLYIKWWIRQLFKYPS